MKRILAFIICLCFCCSYLDAQTVIWKNGAMVTYVDVPDSVVFEENVDLSRYAPELSAITISQTKSSYIFKVEISSIAGLTINYGWEYSDDSSFSNPVSAAEISGAEVSFDDDVLTLTVPRDYVTGSLHNKYLRAYATYSTTMAYSQNVYLSDQYLKLKWDGNVSKRFSGGDGTEETPYLITCGGDLALISKYPNKCFIIVNDIDLDNQSWTPIEDFRGTIDGNNKVIKNLNISRAEECAGFVSVALEYSTIKNITFRNVRIDCPDNSYVGTIAGMNYGVISGCKVILSSDSYIKGMDYVGGLAGYNADADYSTECDIDSCSVTSFADSYVISGNEYVGGIAGSTKAFYNDFGYLAIRNCSVSANIKGTDHVAGIAGYGGTYLLIDKCKYEGKISADSNVGGILGEGAVRYSTCPCPVISSCCARVTIDVNVDYAGGIRGSGYSTTSACYSDGTINAPSDANYIGGIGGMIPSDDTGNTYCSYSTVVCSASNFYGLGYINQYRSSSKYYDCLTVCTLGSGNCKNCHTNAQGTDILDVFKSSGSDYLSKWNLNSTWTWTGTVDGKNITLTCPKLSWEK